MKTSKKSIIIYIDRESEEMQMFNIGDKLKTYRKRKSMSQQEFAQLLGISQNYLSEIESGKHIPSLKTISQIAEKIHTTVPKLLGEKTA